MLLDFPPELLELIISFLDPPSFSLILRTSKALREKILNGGHAFHTQLKAIPGLHQCGSLSCESDFQKLLPLYCRRAAKHCLNGVSVLCDTTTYNAKFPVRFGLGQIDRLEAHHDPHELVAAVQSDTAAVHVYNLQHGFPLPRYIVPPALPFLEADRLEILLVKLHEQEGRRHITILYKYIIKSDPATMGNVFRAEALKKSTHTLKLATYSLSPSEGVNLVTLRDIQSKEWKYLPVTMDVSTNGEVIIIFRMLSFADKVHYKIKSYKSTEKLIDVKPYCVEIFSGPGPRVENESDVIALEQPIISVSLSEEKHLRLCSARNQMPRYHIDNCFDNLAHIVTLSQPSLRDNESFFGSYRWLPLQIGHNHKCMTNASGAECCVSSILQLAILQGSGSKRSGSSNIGLYLVKGSVDSDNCMRIDTDKPFPQLEHEIVGVVQGVDLHKILSHGPIIAVSRKSKRIAIATWDRVQILSLEPDAFLFPKIGSLQCKAKQMQTVVNNRSFMFANRSCEFSHEDDHTYSKNCGQGYYRSYTRLFKRRIVSLEPVDLPKAGVVHRLHFTENDTLWGWTDRGLVKWYWGRGRQARREEKELLPGLVDFAGPVGKRKVQFQVAEEDMMDLD